MPGPTVSPRDTAAILRATARGDAPPVDGLVEVVPRPAGVVAALLAFTGHHVLAADIEPAWVAARLAPWDLSAPYGPPFLAALAERVAAPAGTLDIVLVAPPRAGAAARSSAGSSARAPDLRRLAGAPADAVIAESPHPRRDETVWQTADGAATLVLGRGLADRWEIRFDVEPPARGRGLGRALAAAAPGLAPDGDLVFAQVAPGNVASLRALLAAGYRPIGAEVLFFEPGR